MKKLSLILFTAIFVLGLFSPLVPSLTSKTIFSSNIADAQISGVINEIAQPGGNQEYDITQQTPGEDVKCAGGFTLKGVGCDIGIFFIYNIFYASTQWLASITAGVADNLLWHSIQSWTYQNDFILTGWTIMRDMANISFIAGLLYAAFLLMSGDDGRGKKTVYMVIVLALAINFSLFITRLMIDGGNILARSIYQNIEVVNISDANTHEDSVGSKKQISAGLVQIMNPQRLLQDDSDPATSVATLGDGNVSIFLFLFLFAGIVNVMMMFMFIKIALSFLGRTVGLMILMIMVPATVVSELLPVKKYMPQKFLTLEGWFEEVWKLVVMAPIYMFFIYLMILFFAQASNQFKIQDTDMTDWVSRLISLSMPIIMTYFMMKVATDMTEKLSEGVGSMVAKTAGAVGGAVLGGAMMLTGVAAGRVIGGGIGTLLQKQGANAAASVQDRRLYQAAEKKKKEGREGDMTEDEKKAHEKITAIKTKSADTRTAEEQKSLDRAMGTGKAGAWAAAQDASATRLMSMGSKFRNTNFDPRAAKMFGIDIGGAMTKQLQTTSGLKGYEGYGGMEMKQVATKGTYNQILDKATQKEKDRILEESKVIDEAAKARERKLRENVEKNKSSSQNAEALADLEAKKKANEKGGKRTVEEEADLAVLRAGGPRNLADGEEGKNVTNAQGASVNVNTLNDADLKALKDNAATSAADKKSATDEINKRKDRKISLENKEKSREDLKKDQDNAQYDKDIADKNVKNPPAGMSLQQAKDAQSEAIKNLADAKRAQVLRDQEKAALEKSETDGTYISEAYNADKKSLDKMTTDVADKRKAVAKKSAEVDKIADKTKREEAREALQNSTEMAELLVAEEKKFIQETFIKARKGIASDEELTRVGTIRNGNGKNRAFAQTVNDRITGPGFDATTPATALTDDQRVEKVRLENAKAAAEAAGTTISAANQTLLDNIISQDKRYREQQNYAFAEKTRKDIIALKTHGDDMARVKQQFIDQEIAYVTNYGASIGKNIMGGLALGIATGGASLALGGGAVVAGTMIGAGLAKGVGDSLADFAKTFNYRSMHDGIIKQVTFQRFGEGIGAYDQSLQSRFRGMGGTPPPKK